MADEQVTEPDHTAVRIALWRAMHGEVDAPPHVLEDEVGLRLAAPADGWRERPDMDPVFTSGFRASIVARARFIEDLVAERAGRGTGQYVLLGAGLDTFAQRRPDLASRLVVFEVDQPGTQAWKRQRLIDLGYGVPGVAAAGPGGLRGGRLLAGGGREGRIRRGPARGGGLHRREHVPDQGGEPATLRDLASSHRAPRSR